MDRIWAIAIGASLILSASCGNVVEPVADVPASKPDVAAATDTQAADADAADVGQPAADSAGNPDTVAEAAPAPDVAQGACTTSDDCPASAPACLPGVGACVQCRWANHCPQAGSRCVANQCVPPVACTSSKQCTAANAVCDTAASVCVDCVDKSDCSNGETCVAKQCVPKPAACQSSKDCAKLGLICQVGTGCVDCQGDSDCGKGEFCSDSFCVPDICKAGEASCVDAGHAGKCADNGAGFTKTACPDQYQCDGGACKPVLCKAGEASCQGDLAFKCNPTGTANVQSDDCAAKKQSCVAGACKTLVCKGGATECQGGLLATCSADGLSWNAAPCGSGTVCAVGACKPVICTANAKSCDGAKVMLCTTDGTGTAVSSDCATAGNKCKDGQCVPPVCKPDETKCQDGQLATCDAAQLGWSLAPCPGKLVCDKGACVKVVCTPSMPNCNADELHQCDAIGANNPLVENCAASGKVCDAGECKKPICKPGSTQCQGDQLAICNAKGLGYDAQPCPAGKACGPSLQCETMICAPGQKTCNGDSYVQCDAVGLAFTKLADCAASGQVCTLSGCQAQVCKPFSTECQGDQLATCTANGIAWTKSACPLGQACDKGICLETTCKPGDLACAGNKLLQCDPKGIAMALAKDCTATNQVCDAQQCKTPICSPGAVQCQGAKLATCNAKGLAWDPAPCPNGMTCEANACKAVICAPGDKLCLGDALKTCNANGTGYLLTEDCAAGGKLCDALQCKAPVCKPNEVLCADAQSLSTCDGKGLSAATAPCPNGQVCNGGKCLPLLCPPGAKYCDGKVLSKCAADGLSQTVVQDCALTGQVCDQALCKSLLCAPKATECQSGKLATCAADGLSWVQSACPANTVCTANSCKPIICTPGALNCKADVVQICDATGTGLQTAEDCAAAGKVCDAGQCKTGVCAAGAITCDVSGKVKTCDAKGLTFTLSACAAGKSCLNGLCVPQICTPGAFSCSGNVLQQCDAVGLAQNATQDCAKISMVCDKDACKALLCQPSAVSCQGDKLAICLNSGLDYYVTDCQAGKVCDQGACKAQICQPNAKLCSGFTTQVCDAKGLKLTTGVDCALAQQTCINGACVATACWPPGFKKCAGPQVATCKGDASGFDIVLCNDNDACTSNNCNPDTVVCEFPPNKDCNDNDLCTADSCDKLSGQCINQPLSGPCDDGNGCTTGETCAGGKCAPPLGYNLVTVAGGENQGGNDGKGAQASFYSIDGVAVVGSTVWIVDSAYNRIRKMSADGTVTSVAGMLGTGSSDGLAADAKFNNPQGMAADGAGTLYIADRGNHRIRRMTGDGNVTTLAGSTSGYLDGPVGNAKFSSPSDVALNPKTGWLYVADSGNQRVRAIKPDGSVVTVCGSGNAGYGDGPCSSAQFNGLEAIAVGPDGSVYLGDYANYRIRKIAPDNTVTTIAGSGGNGYQDGSATSAKFNATYALLVGPGGEVYVGDAYRVRAIVKDQVTTVAGGGSGKNDGAATAFSLVYAKALAWGAGKQLWLGDSTAMRKLSSATSIDCDDLSPCTIDSCDSKTGKCVFAPAQLNAACDDFNACTAQTACDGKGACAGTAKNCDDSNACTFDVCDALTGQCDNHATNAPCTDGTACTQADTCVGGKCVVDLVSVTTPAGSSQGYQDGSGSGVKLSNMWGMVVDAAGTLVIADTSNHVIRQMTPDGKVSTVAGIGGQAGYVDGGASQAKFTYPQGISLDGQGRYVVADKGNNRIRLIDPKTWQVTTIAGSGNAGYSDGPTSSAAFNLPTATAVDASGAIYVMDANNYRVRKISGGNVTTVAGSGNNGKQDGAATSASFGTSITYIAMAADGGLLISDTNNHAIRKLLGGQVTTLTGGSNGYLDGPIGSAKFSAPVGVGVDPAGNIYVAEAGNLRLRRISSLGTVTTESGNGTSGQTDGLGTAGSYVGPTAIAVASNGVAYVADQFRIRKSTAAVVDCNDGKQCTADACDAKTGLCSNKAIANGGQCEDGDGCTAGETCTDAVCKGGTPKSCDDSNPCTADSCDSKTGCLNAPANEWQTCGGAVYCVQGTCGPSPCGANPPSACLGMAGTTILSAGQQTQLMAWQGGTVNKWKLCYKGSKDGFNSSTFHALCDAIGPTITVFHSKAGEIFGGYNFNKWTTGSQYLPNPNGWLYSLSKGQKYPINTNTGCSNLGTYNANNLGPTFGGGFDLSVGANMTTGTSAFPYTYICPTDPTNWCVGSQTCNTVLAGSYSNWVLDEVEVFYPAP